MTISNAFGPLTGPANALDRLIDPLNTTVSLTPTLSAKLALNPFTSASVAERLICRFAMVGENALPQTALGRYLSSRITSTLFEGNSRDEYTFCNRSSWCNTDEPPPLSIVA